MFRRLWLLAGALPLLAACAGPSVATPTPPAAAAPIPAATALPAPTQPPAPSNLSYGLVKSQVRKGETTQLELVQLFGAPNITSLDSDGIETWVYEKTVTQTDVQSQSAAAQGAANLGLFFSSVAVGGNASGSQSTTGGSATTSVRSITVIVKFAPNQTVSDYRVRASYF